MIIRYQNYAFQVTIIDFLIVFIVELFFFALIMSKLSIKEYLGTLAITSLLKVGFLSLFISWIPLSYSYTFKTVTLFTVMLLLSGCVISFIIFQRELLLPKNESFNLAFQVSVLSSSVFYMIKIFFIPENHIMYANVANSSFDQNFASFGSFTNIGGSGLLFLILGCVLFFFFTKNKNSHQTSQNNQEIT